MQLLLVTRSLEKSEKENKYLKREINYLKIQLSLMESIPENVWNIKDCRRKKANRTENNVPDIETIHLPAPNTDSTEDQTHQFAQVTTKMSTADQIHQLAQVTTKVSTVDQTHHLAQETTKVENLPRSERNDFKSMQAPILQMNECRKSAKS